MWAAEEAAQNEEARLGDTLLLLCLDLDYSQLRTAGKDPSVTGFSDLSWRPPQRLPLTEKTMSVQELVVVRLVDLHTSPLLLRSTRVTWPRRVRSSLFVVTLRAP